jgi:hypothetical protein
MVLSHPEKKQLWGKPKVKPEAGCSKFASLTVLGGGTIYRLFLDYIHTMTNLLVPRVETQTGILSLKESFYKNGLPGHPRIKAKFTFIPRSRKAGS